MSVKFASEKISGVSRVLRVLTWLTVFFCLLLLYPAGYVRAEVTSEIRRTLDYFGTVCQLRIDADFSAGGEAARFEQMWLDVKALLETIDRSVSTEYDDSDIARFNRLDPGESTAVSPLTAAILTAAKDVYELTGGLFDPTVHVLVDLWGFTPRFATASTDRKKPYDRPYETMQTHVPDADSIARLLPLVDFSGVVMEGDEISGYTLIKTTPNVIWTDGTEIRQSLDLGGIAKGYAVERVNQLLRERGYSQGLFSSGGSSTLFLKNGIRETGTFQIGTDYGRFGADHNEPYLYVLTAADRILSTSGDARQVRVIDGIRYSHIINPGTGWPVNTPFTGESSERMSLVSLLGDSGTRGDVVATALCLMNPAEALSFLDAHFPAWQVLFLTCEGDEGAETYRLYGNLDKNAFEVRWPEIEVLVND